MEYKNRFDEHLAARKIKEPFLGAAVDVADTLDIAWDAVQSVFGEQATPEQAIAVTDLMLRAAGRLQRHDDPDMP
jgi:hypothetical protein